jgi:hypothetical protein
MPVAIALSVSLYVWSELSVCPFDRERRPSVIVALNSLSLAGERAAVNFIFLRGQVEATPFPFP